LKKRGKTAAPKAAAPPPPPAAAAAAAADSDDDEEEEEAPQKEEEKEEKAGRSISKKERAKMERKALEARPILCPYSCAHVASFCASAHSLCFSVFRLLCV
jgi:hypothetical protein